MGSRHAGVATVHKAGVIDRHFSPLTVLCVVAPDLFRHAILCARVCAGVRASVLRKASSLRVATQGMNRCDIRLSASVLDSEILVLENPKS